MAELEAAYRAADAACFALNDTVVVAETVVRGAALAYADLLRPAPHVTVPPAAKRAAIERHSAACAAFDAAKDALSIQQRKTQAAYAEARVAAAHAHAPALRAGCERRIELAGRADELRRELAEIEAAADKEQREMNAAALNGAGLPFGLHTIGPDRLGSADEERQRWSDILMA